MTTEIPTNIKNLSDISVASDAAVLGLEMFIRTGKRPTDLLQSGISLCDYVLGLLQQNEQDLKISKENADYRNQLLDRFSSAFTGSDAAVAFFNSTRSTLQQLATSDKAVNPEELSQIQKTLIKCSMPVWRERHRDFRLRRLKRGLHRNA